MLLGLASLAAGAYLTQDSIDRSWQTFTPPDETESRTVFQPYLATLVPGVVLLGTGVLGVAAVLLDALEVGSDRKRVYFLTYGSANLAFGITLFLHALSYSFFLQCSDPGGCQELFLPFWPAILPGIALVVAGLVSVGFWIRGPPELPQLLTRSA